MLWYKYLKATPLHLPHLKRSMKSRTKDIKIIFSFQCKTPWCKTKVDENTRTQSSCIYFADLQWKKPGHEVEFGCHTSTSHANTKEAKAKRKKNKMFVYNFLMFLLVHYIRFLFALCLYLWLISKLEVSLVQLHGCRGMI